MPKSKPKLLKKTATLPLTMARSRMLEKLVRFLLSTRLW